MRRRRGRGGQVNRAWQWWIARALPPQTAMQDPGEPLWEFLPAGGRAIIVFAPAVDSAGGIASFDDGGHPGTAAAA